MTSSFAAEVWVKYSVAIAIMTVRFITRWKLIGWRNFDGTDLWCVIATALYTIVSTCDYILSTPNYPTNIGLTPETAKQIPDEQIPLIERGSKVAHFSWTMYICMIFSFKGVMLSLFRKVGMDIWRQEMLVFYTTIFVVMAWVASVLTHICACLPVSRVSQVKEFPGPYCTTRPQNYYVAGVLNMLTDAIIIFIPMPMLWKLQIPIRRKIALGVMFGSGIFIIICTILRTYYSLGNVSNIETAQAWAGREGLVCMIVVSAPGIWPLVGRSRWFQPSCDAPYNSGSTRSGAKTSSARRWRPRSTLRTDCTDDGYKLSSRPTTRDAEAFHSGASAEAKIDHGRADKTVEADVPQPITVTTEVSVERERIETHEEASALVLDRVRRTEW